jgi:CTP:phosphocholine cytidylyltransferase-like protein
MTISRTHFEVLSFLEREKTQENISQRAISQIVGISINSVKKILLYLNKNGLLKNIKLTQKAYKVMEPYKVKRAIFIAAGLGSRMIPITLNTPKPLVRIKGVRIIDTLLDAVYAAGINDIIIVRGYLGEQFDQLKYKYPNIKFVDNPLFNEANNISSMMCARFKLQDSYVIDSDLFMKNPELISKYQYTSNYLGIPTDYTDDWCFETKDRVIRKIRIGGKKCHQWIGISYWNKTDGKKLASHIKQVYEMPGGKELFWDQVPLEYFKKEYTIEVRECSFDDVIEIDTFNELKKIDENYKI